MNWEEIKKRAFEYATKCAEQNLELYSEQSNQNKKLKIRQDFYFNKLAEWVVYLTLMGNVKEPNFRVLKKQSKKINWETNRKRIKIKNCPPSSIGNYGHLYGWSFSALFKDPIFEKSDKDNLIIFVVTLDEDNFLIYGIGEAGYVFKNLVVTSNDWGNKNKKYFKVKRDTVFDVSYFKKLEKEVHMGGSV